MSPRARRCAALLFAALTGCGIEPPVIAIERAGAAPSAPLRLVAPGEGGGALCVDIRSAAGSSAFSTANGTRAQLWTCAAGQKNQAFTRDGSMVRVFDDQCLNVVDGRNQNGAGVQIWRCSAADKNSQWDWDGRQLRWRGTDKCLDVTNGRFRPAAPLQIWACNAQSTHQAFSWAAPKGATVAPRATTGTRMDLRQWTQEVHEPGAFNHEQQAYTGGGQNAAFDAAGVLTITAVPTGGESWTSARLSGPEMGPLPWYLEADIVAPTGQGSWPAFWLTARGSWPQGGEIDQMEQINGTGETHISTHWGAQTGVATFNTHEVVAGIDARQRHRYGVFCSNDGVQFYLDGKPIGARVQFPAESNFAAIAAKMVPIVNVAMGGDWPKWAPQETGEQKMVVYSVSRAGSPP